ncbi:ABC transporter ATP-binding protein [Haloplanus pelagicus]|jgi:oligopeptide/dipeptide ABC transporter ATP-binding protein|uniref:ABC transporter ATP-binding protein n=1 Tax=Haloplanus pelagicus TaxID=2949995 RepID=UPI00203DC0B6|nr:ABC transporter ATP-binding protein [Haloplanus sp. HW8-1]
MSESASGALLDVRDLTIEYETDRGTITAVSDVSFTVDEAEYFGLAGESGSGKSTIIKAIMGGLDSNGQVASGEIYYKEHPVHDMSERELNEHIRWNEISWIPQSSMNSLDPLKRVSDQAIDIASRNSDLSEDEALERFKEMFELVGIQESRIHDYPHQFSGGMQQRAIIALALFLDPELIIADEPTTALDVLMQDQIFQYLTSLRDQSETSAIVVTHDISIIFESCDSMALMHAGQMAEIGTVEEVHGNPRHPYALLFQNAFPDIRYPKQDLEIIDGHPPEMLGETDFCSFVDRCPWATEECRNEAPPETVVEEDDQQSHRIHCFHGETAYQEYRSERQATEPVEMEDSFNP